MLKFLTFLIFIQIISSGETTEPCEKLLFLPMPNSIKCNITAPQIQIIEPCKILYQVSSDQKIQHVQQLIRDQQNKTFNCGGLANVIFNKDFQHLQFQGFVYTVIINIDDNKLKSVFTVEQEAYEVDIDTKSANITAKTYVGFVHGLQTFLQSIECPKLKYTKCFMKALPLSIKDQPAFVYRGLMIDTSRHFLPTHLLYQSIDAMMYNKMNVLHWHITDQDAFPLILESHPEIAQYGAFSEEETYTAQQARDIVKYAMVRGVRIIPELDTPGHAASWRLAPENKEVACTFKTGYMGPLDVTLDKTYTLIKQVFAQIFDIFPDPVIHCGGDQVILTCLTNKTKFVNDEQISENDIERHFRRKQHKIIKELNSNKIPMYWMNNKIEIEQGDIVHWWGRGNPETKNPVVISNYGPYYLDMGVGNYLGSHYGTYITWLDLYNQNIGNSIKNYTNKDNVLGAEIALWSQMSNRYTHHLKIWIRGCALAQRVWNMKQFNPKPDFLRRITAQERLMNRRGIPTAPATCEQCQTHPQFC